MMQHNPLYTMSSINSGIDYRSEKIALDFKECIETVARKIAKEEIEKFKQELNRNKNGGIIE